MIGWSGWRSAIQSAAQTVAQLAGQAVSMAKLTLTSADTDILSFSGGGNKTIAWAPAGARDMTLTAASGLLSYNGNFLSQGQLQAANGLSFTDFVDDSANPGNRTVNANRGKNAIAAGASTCVVTNNRVTATRMVLCSLEANDATALYIRSVVPSGTGFTITVSANTTANLVFSWVVLC